MINSLHLSDEQLQGYLDGQPDDREFIQQHLRTCASCRLELQSYQQLYSDLEEQVVPEIMSQETLNGLVSAATKKRHTFAIWENILIIGSILLSVSTSFYFYNPLPLLGQLGTFLLNITNSFSETLGPQVTKSIPIIVGAIIILWLFDLADRKFIRTSSALKGK